MSGYTCREAYEAHLKEHSNKLSGSSIARYKNVLETFVFEVLDPEMSVDSVDDDDVGAYISLINEEYAPKTVVLRYNTLKGWFSWLIDNDEIDGRNPAKEVDVYGYNDIERGNETKTSKKLRAKEGIIYVTESEVEEICRNVPAPVVRNELMIRLAFATGLRPVELVHIRLRDVDFPWDESRSDRYDPRLIKIETAKRRVKSPVRHVWFPKSLDKGFNLWLTKREGMRTAYDGDDVDSTRENPYLFITNRDSHSDGLSPITAHTFNEIVKTAAERAGIQETVFIDQQGNEQKRVTAKALRHGFAVHSVREGSGIDIRSLQLLLGHESISTTEKYLKFQDDVIKSKQMKFGPL